MKKLFIFLTLVVFVTNSYSQDVDMQNGTVNQCSGIFYDSGGEFGPYGNDENFVLTICPENAGQLVELNFTEFSTQLNADVMTIYNGDSVAAPIFGTFSGVANPGFVAATPANPTGCITIQFVSDGGGNTSGWAADITCRTPCQTIVSQLDSSTPAPNGDGYIRVCPNEDITLTGSGQFSVDGTGSTYEWDLGDGNTATGQTATFSYTTPGVYIVNLNIRDANTSIDPLGCPNTNLINQVIQVGTEPDFTGTVAAQDTICFGDSTTIDGVVTPVEFINDCTPPIAQTTFLPDGSGAVYTTCITVDCFESTQTLDNVNQLIEICLNIEHSFSGDLDIRIISPNGQDANLFLQAGGGTYWGGANDDGSATPGIGADYCFSMSATTLLQNAPTIIAGSNPPNASWTPGTYLPVESFASLIGSPLNGDWCIEVVDNLAIDNGYIFSWGMEFDPAIQPPELSFTPVTISETWDADPSIINTVGNTITVQPTTAGTHCYTYRVIDDFDCEYTEVICIEVLPEIINDAPNNLFICGAGAPPFEFDLSQNDAVILASNPNPGDFVVTYHITQLDADNDIAPIANPATYVGTDGQIIYVRIEYLTSDCFETSTFTLNLQDAPTINPVADLEVCDDDSNDGFEAFNLQSQDLGILGIQPIADFAVTYYTSFADADSSTNALVSPYTNTVNPQPIFVRIETITDANCFVVSPTAVFDLIVNEKAIANQPLDLELCDDITNDGIAQFDLTTQTTTILGGQDPLVFNVTYHENQADADSGMNIIPNPATYNNNISSPQTIYVRVEDPLNPTCYGTITFELIVNPLPGVIISTPLEECDDNVADGFTPFNLSDKTVEISNGQVNIIVSYHETFVDADTNTNPLADGYVNTVINAQTIFVRLENTLTNCYNTTTLGLVVNANPSPVVPTNLEVCDDDNDGFSEFDLSLKDLEILGLQVGMTVSYYETQSDADNGVNVLPTLYNNIVPSVQTVYARLEDDATGCYATVELILIVNPLPVIDVITTYELCDDNNPGDEIEDFDLSTKDAEIINGQVNVSISYYETQAEADTSTNPIIGLYANTSNPQTIYVRLENTITSCAETGAFELMVNPLPQLVVPTPLEVCDDSTPDGFTVIDLTLKNIEISGNNPNYSVTYYFTQADADAEVNPLAIPYTNITNPQTIYVRVEDINTACFDTTTLDLVVQQAPIAFVPTPLLYCDPDSDGFGVFTLTDADTEITGGDVTLTVSYHETFANADNNVDAIDTIVPYNNIVQDTQTLYARVESATIATDCATIVELQLIVEPTPQIEDPTALEVCDDISADGFAQFDLTTKDAEVLNGLDPLQYTVTYYETEVNADADINPIGAPNAYTNTTAFTQIIWIRVEDTTTLGGCYKLTTLELIVNALPVLQQPAPLELCDVNNPGDEQEAFTLENANAEILNGQTGITLTYYETQADADAGTNPVTSPYTNTINPQTIYVRAEHDVTGCINTITITLRVNPIPSPEPNPTPIEECDADNDGFESFDLESRTVEIINGELDVVITYHETQADADNALNALVSPYTNIVPDTQMVYARAENTLTGCFTVVELQLIVLPSPEIPVDLSDYMICDTDSDGIAQFDLTTKDSEVLGTQVPADFVLTYHLTQADADTGNNPIVNVTNFTNSSNPQTLYVRLVSNGNGCISTGEFELVVELPPTAVQPTPLELCDDVGEVGDELTEFDLTIKANEITGGNASWAVSYYETDADSQADTNVIPDPTMYTNTSVGGLPANPQTLYVRVTDTDTGCTDFTTLTIRVLPNPTPSLNPDNIELCDDINTGDGVEEFDLTINEIFIINGEAGVTATYHETPEDGASGDNVIADPTLYTNIETPEQIIYVRITNDVTGCYTIVTFNIIVNPLPDVVAVTDFIACELNTDGVYDFDLTTKDAEVLNGQDPIEFTVSYHETQADADAEQNGLVSPYTNITNPQQIFVAITNNTTGCSISTQSFNIEVQEAAEANSDMVPIVFEACDDEMETDGDPTNDSVQFDLTTQDADVLDGQDPVNYIVTYYATEADANLGVNPIPTLYENVQNPQIIYARVDNDTPDGTGLDTSICFAVTELTLQVNPLPVFDLDETYILCVNTNGSEFINVPILDTDLSETDYSFEWSLNGAVLPGETSSSLTPSQGGIYSVVVTDTSTSTQTMCQSTDSAEVIESEPPSLTIEILTQAFANNHVIEATAVGVGDYEYSLNGGPWQSSGLFENVSAGEHTITARDRKGCGEASETITVLDYPLFFTPNGDGFNDRWKIYGIDNQTSAIIYIFDRYGKLLKQLSPTGQGWNGTYNGALLPSNDYWFTVEYNEPNTGERKEFTAHFTLKL
jgi:gliding motility-associated-like protein